MDVYVKLRKKAKITGRKTVYLQDVAEVFAPENQGALEKLPLFTIPPGKDASYLVGGLDVVRAVAQALPQATVSCLGESDVIVEYKNQPSRPGRAWEWLKVAAISFILFAGSATAIMSFHTDSQMAQIFRQYYEIFLGEEVSRPYLLEIPYAIGLAAGILVFFNHFSRWRLSQDPTPIQVQVTAYEQQAMASTLDRLERQKKKGEPG